jgi:Flp pilus assembly protein TadG
MRRLNDDRGASVITFAITAAVLLGMVGLAVDAGALYQERRELANGADAAALAIAEDCGLDTRPCTSDVANATAHTYADRNARDGAAGVSSVQLDAGARSITVVTSTENPDGTTVFEPFFASAIGFHGTTVKASATAIWGYPSRLYHVLPLIISECEFPGADALPTPERILYFHDGNNAEPCNAQAGHDTDGDGVLAGGFGWLTTNGSCESDLTIGLWTPADPGSSPSNGCGPEDLLEVLDTAIPLPYFRDLDFVGANGRYEIAGFGMFHITGYNFGGQYKAPDAATAPCGGDERCISGYFTTGSVPDGETGGSNHGVVIVKLTD